MHTILSYGMGVDPHHDPRALAGETMTPKFVLSLTSKERSLLAAILGFVEAGEIDGGPLDAVAPHQRGANLRLFDSLCRKVFRAGNE